MNYLLFFYQLKKEYRVVLLLLGMHMLWNLMGIFFSTRHVDSCNVAIDSSWKLWCVLQWPFISIWIITV